MNEFHRAWQRVFSSLRQATEFQQGDNETISGAASELRRIERREASMQRGVSNHTNISRESSDRGRRNAIEARATKRAQRPKN